MRNLYMFRMENGKKVRYRFELDDQMVIQREVKEKEENNPVFARETRIDTRKDGTKVVKSVSREDQEVLKFFVETIPCWFEGCEDLRKEWADIIKKAGGESCVGCARGREMRKFKPKVFKALFPNKAGADS